jgi:S1-C subfamily serine protease
LKTVPDTFFLASDSARLANVTGAGQDDDRRAAGLPGEAMQGVGRLAMNRASRPVGAALAALALAVAAGAGGDTRPGPGDDLTFRPTVIVRHKAGQGSGTVIASVDGETLVLTAAHVVRDAENGEVGVELHRFNLGVEKTMPARGWPVKLPGTVAASDPVGDVAVVRVRGRAALPFVARLAAAGDEPDVGAVVRSVGVDHGELLTGWASRVMEVDWFGMARPEPKRTSRARDRDSRRPSETPAARTGDDLAGVERPFLITERAPVEGRSGGGLFDETGRLVGVCVGRAEFDHGRARGVFASPESVRRLLRENDLDASVTRSETSRARARAPRR